MTATAPVTGTRPTGSARRAAREGARDMVPMVIAVLPLAVAIGAVIGTSSVPSLTGWAAGPIVFAGAAQLVTIQMLDSGAAPAVIIVSALALNARVLMYGAAIAPWFRTASLRRRLLLAAPLIDPLYLTGAARFEKGDLDDRGRQAYWLGGAAFLAVAFAGVQAIAIVTQASLPESTGLQIAAPLAFAGLLAKSTPNRPAVRAAIVAAAVATVGAGLPFQSAVVVAALAGLAAGGVSARRQKDAEEGAVR